MRKIIKYLVAVAAMLVFSGLAANAQSRTKNPDILIPLHVSAKGWMQALEDQGYKASQVCKLRYADGRLVRGSEAWHSPDVVYITFSKEARVGKRELNQFLNEAVRERRIPAVGEPVLANLLVEREAAQAALEQARLEAAKQQALARQKQAQLLAAERQEEANAAKQTTLFRRTLNYVTEHRKGVSILGAIGCVVLMGLLFWLIIKGQKAPPLSLNSQVTSAGPAERRVEEIRQDLLLDREILGESE